MFCSFTSNKPHVVSHTSGIVVLACVDTQHLFLLGGNGAYRIRIIIVPSMSPFSTCGK